jgi:hypothetical protein
VFQAVALLTALSYIVSYILFVDPVARISTALSGSVPFLDAFGSVVSALSIIVALIVVALALVPEWFSVLSESSGAKGIALRAVVLVVPALWMVNVFIGTPMVDKLITIPFDASGMIPFAGGVFLHVVFQHWFMSVAAIALALVPGAFATLTESSTPAGLQCAVVQCE